MNRINSMSYNRSKNSASASSKTVTWLKDKYDFISNIIQSLIAIGISFLSSLIYELTTADEAGSMWLKTAFSIMIILLSVAIIAFISFLETKIKENVLQLDKIENLNNAFICFKTLEVEQQRTIDDYFDEKPFSIDNMIKWHRHCAKTTVDHCCSYFTNSYVLPGKLLDPIKFEVTFMTESYIDGYITIAEFCNKEGQAPRTMNLRKKNPEIYKGSETDKIYQEYYETGSATIKIIEDTIHSNYKSLYSKQTDRIKSTIILPVLSSKSKLLGTLVVHCNKSGFFDSHEENYWTEILRPYVVELEKNKVALDYLVRDISRESLPF